jgi:nucleotide-binding universal stress UspA family protein
MEDIKKIVFPVDLSDVSPFLAPVALEMARKFGAELHLVLVNEPLDQYAYFYVPPIPDSDIEAAAERELDRFEQKYCRDCTKLKKVILRGDPAEEILRYIKSQNADLAIMGTHGRKGLDRVLFGSVAERVVRQSPVPVLTVNPYRKK